MNEATPFLDVRGVSVVFGGLKAIDGFSMSVRKGQIHALIGPNGAGKSTLFNCISRFYQPTTGSIWLEGREITREPPYAMASMGVARTFQNLELFGGLSVLENIMIGGHAHCAGSLQDRWAAQPPSLAYCEHILERVGLISVRHELAGNLDFGHQKLVEVARALAIRPKLLLLDEPAAGLRNREINALDQLLRELVSTEHITILLVEHVMQLVMSISDTITVLSFGRKLAEGSPTAVRNHPAVVEAYLGRDDLMEAGHS